MGISLQIKASASYGAITATAGTVISRVVKAWHNLYTRVSSLVYTCGSTAHTITVMQPLNKTTLSADAAAGQAVIALTADPGNYAANFPNAQQANNLIAANDYLVVEAPDGTFYMDLVSSVSSLNITMTSNLPTGGLKKNAIVWFYGIITDVNPNTNLAHPKLTGFASATTNIGGADAIAAPVGSNNKYEPLILQSSNGTTAGTIERVTAVGTTV